MSCPRCSYPKAAALAAKELLLFALALAIVCFLSFGMVLVLSLISGGSEDLPDCIRLLASVYAFMVMCAAPLILFIRLDDVRKCRKFINRCCPFCGEEVNHVEL